MSQHIHCIVHDCHYWQQGNMCVANEILVATDKFGAEEPDHVDCSATQQLSPESAGTCMDTCCKTYVSKGSNKITTDSVQKMF